MRSGAPAAGPRLERVAEAGSALHEVRRCRVRVAFVVDDGPVTTTDGSPNWYETLYAGARAGSAPVAWDHGEPTPYLVEWMADRCKAGRRRGRAVIIGCAYGDDAELVASYGFDVTAFDVSPTAVEVARTRNPGSAVDYQCADLFGLPRQWLGAFDLVIECTTLQALPPNLHEAAAAGVASLCAPDGEILVIARCPGDDDPPGPPWLLTESKVRRVATDDVRLTRMRRIAMRGGDHWVGEFAYEPDLPN